jgi:AcrR family transcriptional regulator
MAGRPKASEARDTRADILDVALELFADKGFFGVSIRDVARGAGVSVSAIYHHFPNKEALFEAVVLDRGNDGKPRMGPGLLPVFEGTREELPAFLERVMMLAMDRFAVMRERKRFRIFFSEGPRLALEGKINLWEKVLVARQPMIDLMAQLIDRGLVRPTEPDLLSLSFIAPLMMWRQLLSISPDHPWVTKPREFARHCVEQFLRGALK